MAAGDGKDPGSGSTTDAEGAGPGAPAAQAGETQPPAGAPEAPPGASSGHQGIPGAATETTSPQQTGQSSVTYNIQVVNSTIAAFAAGDGAQVIGHLRGNDPSIDRPLDPEGSPAGPFTTPELDTDAAARQLLVATEDFTPLLLRHGSVPQPPLRVAPTRLFSSAHRPLEVPDAEPDATASLKDGSQTLEDVYEAHPLLILRGDPGAGKSASCRHLARRAAQAFVNRDRASPAPPLPVLVELHGFRVQVGEPAEDALARLVALALRRGGGIDAAYEPVASHGRRWLHDACTFRPLALLLDGLNEIPKAYADSAHDALRQLGEKLAGTRSRMIISTRRHGFEVRRLGRFAVYDILPLGPIAIRETLAARLGIPLVEAERIHEEVLGARMRLQASNPLFLTLLCDVLSEGENVPNSRGELLRLFVEGLLERWESQKTRDFGQRAFPLRQKQRALEELAIVMQSEGRSVPRERAIGLIMRVLGGTSASDEGAHACLEELCTNHVVRSTRDGIVFAHHQFQEYFCATRLASQCCMTSKAWPIDPLLDETQWWEIIALMGTLLDEAEFDLLLIRLRERPVLTGLVLAAGARAKPEATFVREAMLRLEREVRRVLLEGRAVSLSPLLETLASLALLGVVVYLFKNVYVFVFAPLVLVFSTETAGSVALGVSALHCVVCYVWISRALRRWSDRNAPNILYGRHVEPWLLGLRYVAPDAAQEAIWEVCARNEKRIFVDRRMLWHLRRFADVRLDEEVERLLRRLENPYERECALVELGLRYEPTLARELLRDLPRRSASRLGAELSLYIAWVKRYTTARKDLLPLLLNLVQDTTKPYLIRSRLAAMLSAANVANVRAPGALIYWLTLLPAWTRRGIACLVCAVLILLGDAQRRIGFHRMAVRAGQVLSFWCQTRPALLSPMLLSAAVEHLSYVGLESSAHQVLNAALAEYPCEAVLYMYRAWLCQDSPEEAINSCFTGLRHDPCAAPLLNFLFRLLVAAAERADGSLNETPADPDALRFAMFVFRAVRRYIDCVEESLQQAPNDPSVVNAVKYGARLAPIFEQLFERLK